MNENTRFFDFLIPKGKHFATLTIVYINLIVFGLMAITNLDLRSFDTQTLLEWGGNCRQYTLHGDWWRLITSTFVHAGISHIISNMIGLLPVALLLESMIGRWRLFLAYLITGMIAGCASLIWNADIVSVGASGAIMGFYGLLLTLFFRKISPSNFGKLFVIGFVIFFGYNLYKGFSEGIDNAAHIGGILGGFIFGSFFSSPASKEE